MHENPIIRILAARLELEGKSVPMRVHVLSAEGKLTMLRDTANTRWDVRDGALCLYDSRYDSDEPKEIINPNIIAAVDFGQFGMQGEMLARRDVPKGFS
ncbi:MAG: hypothetical protein AAF495_04105 [Pseudomonadota bacterium]